MPDEEFGLGSNIFTSKIEMSIGEYDREEMNIFTWWSERVAIPRIANIKVSSLGNYQCEVTFTTELSHNPADMHL